MDILYKYCKHCGRKYAYQASGYGCDDPNNNSKYCPECMKAINKALNKIPVLFEQRYIAINDSDLENIYSKNIVEEIINDYKKCKAKILETDGSFIWPKVQSMEFLGGFDNGLHFNDNGHKMLIVWNEENEKIVKYAVLIQ